MDPQLMVRAFGIPGAVVFAILMLVWLPWSAKRWERNEAEGVSQASNQQRLRLILTSIVALACFAFSHRAIIGQWPVFPPKLSTSINDWFGYVALIAAAFSIADAMLAEKMFVRMMVRAVACLAACALPVLLLMESEYYASTFSFSENSGPMWIMIAAITSFIGWLAFTPRERKDHEESRLPFALPLGIYLGIVAPTMVLWSVAIDAQFLGAVALCLVPAGVITLWRSTARAYDALLGFAILMTFAIIDRKSVV